MRVGEIGPACGGMLSRWGFALWRLGRAGHYVRLRLSVSVNCHEPLMPGSGHTRLSLPCAGGEIGPACGGMLSRWGFALWRLGRARRCVRLRLSVSVNCHEPLMPGPGHTRLSLPCAGGEIGPACGGMLSQCGWQACVNSSIYSRCCQAGCQIAEDGEEPQVVSGDHRSKVHARRQQPAIGGWRAISPHSTRQIRVWRSVTQASAARVILMTRVASA